MTKRRRTCPTALSSVPPRCNPESSEGSVPSPNQAMLALSPYGFAQDKIRRRGLATCFAELALSHVEGAQHDKTVEHIALLVFLTS